jgi:probable F420-dependent oxidoreductase
MTPPDTPTTPTAPAPPEELVTVLPPDRTVFGMQLPVQSQSTIYVQPWEPAAGPDEMAAVARACESAGFFYVAVCDHTFIPERLAPAMGATWYDTVATLGWLAGVTSSIRLLSHVYVAALRHPLRAAKEFATLDRLSAGRVVCGVGAGHVREEFDLMGPPFEQRGRALDEAVVALARGLAHAEPDLAGPRWPAERVALGPRPVQSPRPPVWIGGSSPAAIRRAARLGDGWLPQSLGADPSLLGELRRLRRELREDAPLDVGGLSEFLYVGSPPSGLDLPRGAVTGPAERLAEALRPFPEAGVGQVQVRFAARSCEELCDQIAAFGSEVVPLVAGD